MRLRTTVYREGEIIRRRKQDILMMGGGATIARATRKRGPKPGTNQSILGGSQRSTFRQVSEVVPRAITDASL